jgi:hypothetical protein
MAPHAEDVRRRSVVGPAWLRDAVDRQDHHRSFLRMDQCPQLVGGHARCDVRPAGVRVDVHKGRVRREEADVAADPDRSHAEKNRAVGAPLQPDPHRHLAVDLVTAQRHPDHLRQRPGGGTGVDHQRVGLVGGGHADLNHLAGAARVGHARAQPVVGEQRPVLRLADAGPAKGRRWLADEEIRRAGRNVVKDRRDREVAACPAGAHLHIGVGAIRILSGVGDGVGVAVGSGWCRIGGVRLDRAIGLAVDRRVRGCRRTRVTAILFRQPRATSERPRQDRRPADHALSAHTSRVYAGIPPV